MSSLNKCTFIGNLGRDPETRSFANGGKVCNLTLAVSERWTDKNSGEKKERTEWIRIAIFSEGLVRVAEQYLRKGSKIYIEGKMETRKYQDQSGADRYTTEVTLRGFESKLIMLDAKGSDNSSGDYSHSQDQGGAGGAGNFDEDSIPF